MRDVEHLTVTLPSTVDGHNPNGNATREIHPVCDSPFISHINNTKHNLRMFCGRLESAL
jgi:hypothetical protein